MTARLFRRGAVLTVAKPVEGRFFGVQPNAVVVRDLRVQFTVERDLGSDPNRAEIVVSNLAAGTRSELQVKPLHVRLDAGYDGQLSRLAEGDLIQCSSRRSGTDWETKFLIGDGQRARDGARLSRTYKAGTSVQTVLGDLAGAYGLKLPKSSKDAHALAGQFVGGITLGDPSHEEMTRILGARGYGWSVQDGQLQILADGQVRPDEAVVVEQDSGLIGAPEMSDPDKDGGPPTVSFSVLLDPRIVPGGRVLLRSKSVRGLFRADKVKHQGDTHGRQWQTDVEATPLPGELGRVPAEAA